MHEYITYGAHIERDYILLPDPPKKLRLKNPD